MAMVVAIVLVGLPVPAPAAPEVPAPSSWLALYSTPGDNILGGGHVLLQPSANLSITAYGTPTGLSVQIRGTTQFDLFFAPAQGQTLSAGYYGGAAQSADATHPKIDIWGRSVACNLIDGEFVINDIAFAGSALTRFDITFVQHCERGLPALLGQVSYNESPAPLLVQASSLDFPPQYVGVSNISVPISVTNTTALPLLVGAATARGPGAPDIAITADDCPALLAPLGKCVLTVAVTPRATGLRQSEIDIATDSLPVSVSFRDPGIPGNAAFALDSEPGDFVGAGQQLAFNQFNSAIGGTGGASEIDFTANADSRSLYAIVVPPAGQQLAVADYPDAQGLDSRAPDHPGIQITTNLAGSQFCTARTGRFNIREIGFDSDGRVIRLAADLEQHCNGGPGLFVSLRLASSIGYSVLAVAPSTDSLTFPAVLPGSPAPAQLVRISNAGVVPVSLSPPVVTGVNGADFQAGSSTCASSSPVAPGASCTMSVTFTPHDFGDRTATFGVAAGTLRGQITVALLGTGAPPPGFTNPLDGEKNVDTTKPFTWATSPQADGYLVVIGTTPGTADLLNTGILPPTRASAIVPGMPQAVPIYATLFTRSRGRWDFHQSITFTTFATAARFTYPVADMTNVDPTRAITWTANRQALGYRLRIGTQPGGSDLLDSGPLPTSQSSYNPPPLPANTTLYATIVTGWIGFWQTNPDIVRFVVQAAQATFTNPLNGARIVNATAPYTWSLFPGAQAYYLVVSTTPGGANLINSGVLPATRWYSSGVPLPKNVKLYGTVFTQIAGSWSHYQTITFSSG